MNIFSCILNMRRKITNHIAKSDSLEKLIEFKETISACQKGKNGNECVEQFSLPQI